MMSAIGEMKAAGLTTGEIVLEIVGAASVIGIPIIMMFIGAAFGG